MRYLESATYSAMMGTATNMEPAAKMENSLSSSELSPTATVYEDLSTSSILGSMKSAHGHTKEVSAV